MAIVMTISEQRTLRWEILDIYLAEFRLIPNLYQS